MQQDQAFNLLKMGKNIFSLVKQALAKPTC